MAATDRSPGGGTMSTASVSDASVTAAMTTPIETPRTIGRAAPGSCRRANSPRARTIVAPPTTPMPISANDVTASHGSSVNGS